VSNEQFDRGELLSDPRWLTKGDRKK